MSPARPSTAPYDVDVVVVGGGPAGLSAAVRVRWIKSYRTLCCSVAVFEPGRLGGLATWRTCSLTGPGWRFLGDGLAQEILTDVERYHVPIVAERVVDVRREGGLFRVTGSGGTSLRCLAVIVACGMRPLANEARFIGRGLFITYMGYAYFPRLLERLAEAAGPGEVVIVGNERSRHLEALARAALPTDRVTWLLHEADGVELPDLPGRVLRGELLEVLGQGDDAAGFDAGDASDPTAPDLERAHHRGVTGVRTTAGVLPCAAVLLDYNAWELRTHLPWDGLGLVAPGCFVQVDASSATKVPGVFAAGDVTGRWRSTLMALGDGVNAGFGAVRHVHLRKLGKALNLYAYEAQDRALACDELDVPALEVPMVPVLLAPPEEARRPLARDGQGHLVALLDGVNTLGEVAVRGCVPFSVAASAVATLIELKLATVHVVVTA